MTTTTHRRSRADLHAEAETLHKSIATQVEQLQSSDEWARFLRFAGSFHQYSLNNVLLILAQRPDATRVAGYRGWQQKGRQVRTGEQGIRIFGHATTRILKEDDTGEETERQITYYPIVTVFDISQTDLIDGHTDDSTPTHQLTGTSDHGILAALTAALGTDGWTVTSEPLRGTVNGYTNPATRQVVLRADLSPEHAAKTLLHETAHVFLEHVADLTEYRRHRGRMETEAESVAYVVAGLIGFDTSSYSVGYITHWSNGDTTLIKNTAGRVLAATDHILSHLNDTQPDTGSKLDPDDRSQP